MSEGNEFREHASSSKDFYALLEIEPHATEAEIRRAYRQTARKYHPDKVGASDTAASEKFQLLQIAYGVLSDESNKALYDNARKVREEKKARESAFSDRRRAMVEELERRENASKKRTWDDLDDDERQEQEKIRRIAADGKRRREELQAKRQREAEILEQEELAQIDRQSRVTEAPKNDDAQDLDRAISLRYVKNEATSSWDAAYLESIFGGSDTIEATVLKAKRIKPPGEKHRQDYVVATILFRSLISASAAITAWPRLQSANPDLNVIEEVSWAGRRKGPDSAHQPTISQPIQPANNGVPRFSFSSKSHAQHVAKT